MTAPPSLTQYSLPGLGRACRTATTAWSRVGDRGMGVERFAEDGHAHHDAADCACRLQSVWFHGFVGSDALSGFTGSRVQKPRKRSKRKAYVAAQAQPLSRFEHCEKRKVRAGR